ncbi:MULTISPECIES: phosphoenolpyruvate--protein phosphotransferase [Pseudomonas syringae group]|uniref:phosphoenolpyruvate--protein phosphotransferase n=2 Tax=Pseudomonas syringae group TaxID=136849 RepID=A0A2V4QDI4_PSESJ|nr:MULTISPECIES: phosphoenolpyruvate--protein phosphotransferase [Pseudomonas syringae group]PYD12822.1 phosphoenolpyruvate--protein phosphotransferase [Pseudomonas syringae pv. pisi]PYD28672.1 phosphoenolpyruvate--protein phosphotransferase [Pseudomonas syringae pv. pisi]PYD30308.1 phosphoenolpyruvate--protein phosphotransferase [Pseudomonas syringae pv. pisi]RMO32131.1 Phosphoenolpyruvate-protein phosphotransferase [Pseudomonas syringae pv. pisi]RMU89598.1 Phosphoenolpyruvate-protein phospho
MLELTLEQISMAQSAVDKTAALKLIADHLVADGLVAEGYLTGLMNREQQGSTFLGQGIAIPHGTPETRDLVFTTGVRLMQFPEGVDWGDGQMVYLAIGIAAKSDEHLRLLQLLTRALGEEDLGQALREAKTPEDLLKLLQGAPQELALDAQMISLGVSADDFEELVWRGARLLRKADCVSNGFAAVLQQVEALSLGDGLWWLHSEQTVNRPGLAFVTPDKPMRYLGQPLTGLFCLASLGEAHQALLERLCLLLIEGRGHELGHATNSRAVLEALGGELPAEWPTRQIQLANAHGLHARPAKILAQLAKEFDGEIRMRVLETGEAAVSAKSLSKLLSLGARRGQTLEFIAEPTIADDALPALIAAVEQGLGEEVEPLPAVSQAEAAPAPTPAAAKPLSAPPAGSVLQAVSASPGIAMGPAHIQVLQSFDYPQRGESVTAERERLHKAIGEVRSDIENLIQRSKSKAIREIFITHQEMLEDPELTSEVEARLNNDESAAAAWATVIETAAVQQEQLQDALLAERAADLRDVGRRVLAQICGVETVAAPDEPYILVMDEVGPSDVARLDPAQVAGILTARGGATAHSAIVARALGIPALVGAGDEVLLLKPGTVLLIDSQRGRLTVAPDEATLQRAVQDRDAREQRLKAAAEARMEPAVTRDGHAVEVFANIGDSTGTPAAVEQGAEGVGLLRTELLFMAHSQAPDEATQEAEYRRVLTDLGGRPLVVRTLDVGGDKPLPYWPIAKEENPFLGVRGIRLTLQRPDVMESQLRALLRSADSGPLRIMFPMIGTLEEWRQARDMTQRLREEIPVSDLQLGIMIEVPSAALIAPVLAKEVDFFSIGTNDLTQYTMAIDRGHPTLSAQADGLHPSVLQLIDMTVRAAHANGKWVGVCGELAADPLAVPILVGLGVDELSVSARSIGEVKACVRELTLSSAQQLAQNALAAGSAAEVRALVEAV